MHACSIEVHDASSVVYGESLSAVGQTRVARVALIARNHRPACARARARTDTFNAVYLAIWHFEYPAATPRHPVSIVNVRVRSSQFIRRYTRPLRLSRCNDWYLRGMRGYASGNGKKRNVIGTPGESSAEFCDANIDIFSHAIASFIFFVSRMTLLHCERTCIFIHVESIRVYMIARLISPFRGIIPLHRERCDLTRSGTTLRTLASRLDKFRLSVRPSVRPIVRSGEQAISAICDLMNRPPLPPPALGKLSSL